MPELGITINTSGIPKNVTDLNSVIPAAQGVETAVTKMTQTVNQQLQQSGTITTEYTRKLQEAMQRQASGGGVLGPSFDFDKMRQAIPGIEKLGRELDQLRLKYVPLAAAEAAHAQALAEIQRANAMGVLSAVEMAAAIDKQTAALARQKAALTGASGKGAANDPMARMNQTNMMYQFQDIAVTAAMGMNPAMIALQQGSQMAMNFSGAGGITAGLKGMASGLMAMVQPATLLPILIVGIGAAMYQWLTGADKEAKDLNTTLKEHEKALNDLREAYGLTALKAEDFYQRSRAAAQAAANVSAIETEKKRVEEVARVYTETQEYITPRGTPTQGLFSSTTPDEYKMAAAVQEALRTNDFAKLEASLAAIAGNNPELQKQMDIWLNSVDAVRKLNAELEALNKTEKEIIQNYVRPEGKPADPAFIERRRQEMDAAERRQQIEHDRRIDAAKADVASLNARSPVEKARAVWMAEMARYIEGETELEKTDRIKITTALALARAEKEVADARKSRLDGYDKLVSDAQLELDILGKTTAEQAALRKEYELTYQLRQYAAEHNIEVDQKELDLIHEKVEAQRLLTKALNDQKLMQDLLFEQQMLLMNPADRGIARRLRDTGLGMDSPQAGQMRTNAQIEEITSFATSTAKDLLGSFADVLSEGGDDLGERLVEALVGSAQRTLDKILDRLLDDIINTLLFGQGGAAGGGGGTGGLIGAFAEMLTGSKSGTGGGGGGGATGGGVIGDALKSAVDAFTTGATGGGGGGGGFNFNATSAGTTANRTGNIPLSRIDVGNGQFITVATAAAPQFAGLVADLKSQGYPVERFGSAGGYQDRYVKGTHNLSQHAYGGAIDIDPARNPYAYGAKGSWSKYGIDPSATAAKYGLEYGGDWKKADTMHFQVRRGTDLSGGSDHLTAASENLVKSFTKQENIVNKTTSAMTDAARATKAAADGVGDMGDSAAKAAEALTKFPAAPSGGGGGGGIGGFLKDLFGGGGGMSHAEMWEISPAATAAIEGGAGGLYHTGGIAGSPKSSRYFASMAPWLDAVRLHKGNMFGAGEYPAVLKQGEPVFSSMAQAQEAMGGKTQVNIHNYVGAEVKVEEKRSKQGSTLEVIVDRMQAANMDQRGTATNNAMRSKFGLQERMKMR